MTLREKIEVMEAFERGEEIEVSYVKQDKWTDISNPDWSWGAYNYRIKPKSKQTVTIERWLCMYKDCYVVKSTSDINTFLKDSLVEKIKLLSTDTYEIELP